MKNCLCSVEGIQIEIFENGIAMLSFTKHITEINKFDTNLLSKFLVKINNIFMLCFKNNLAS